jgi:parallel beta-helix repeat protein
METKRTVFGLALCFLLFVVPVLVFNIPFAKSGLGIWTVDDDGPADFRTIEEAVLQADEGDTVYVKKGTYYGEISVYKSLNLIGEDRAKTIIDANSTPQAGTQGIYVHHGAKQVVIRGFTVKNGDIGILLANDLTMLSHNILTENWDGVWTYGSGHRIVDNEITSNIGYGANLRNVDNCTLYGNTFEGNYIGVYVDICDGSISVANTFFNNTYGVYLTQISANNTLYHNNFINNTCQVGGFDSGQNTLDNGYPSGGNYWSDYIGNDSFSGPYQSIIGSDCIGDIPYTADSNDTDRYPLIRPYIPLADLNLDTKVDLADSFILLPAFGSQPASLEWNPRADLNGDLKVDILDAIILSINFGKSYV